MGEALKKRVGPNIWIIVTLEAKPRPGLRALSVLLQAVNVLRNLLRKLCAVWSAVGYAIDILVHLHGK